MITHKQIRENSARNHYDNLKKLRDDDIINTALLFDKLPEDLQWYTHHFMTPKEQEQYPLFEYEDLDLR